MQSSSERANFIEEALRQLFKITVSNLLAENLHDEASFSTKQFATTLECTELELQDYFFAKPPQNYWGPEARLIEGSWANGFAEFLFNLHDAAKLSRRNRRVFLACDALLRAAFYLEGAGRWVEAEGFVRRAKELEYLVMIIHRPANEWV